MPDPEKTLAHDVSDINYDKIYEHMRIKLDGREFHRCEFAFCTMVYGGGFLPVLDANAFNECQWEMTAEAGNTLRFLSVLYRNGGGAEVLVEQTFDMIRGAARPRNDNSGGGSA